MLLYHWINRFDYEKVRDKYKDLYKDKQDKYFRKFDLILKMQNYVVNNIKTDRDLIEYYFKQRNSDFCTLAYLALLLDFGKISDDIPTYEERTKSLSLSDRVLLYASNINYAELQSAPKEKLVNESDLITFLEATALDTETKWEAVKIFSNQEKYYNEAAGILKETMELLENNFSEILDELSLEFYDYWNSCMESVDIIKTLNEKLKISWDVSESGCIFVPMIFSPYQISIALDSENRKEMDLIRIGIALDKRFVVLVDRKFKKEDVVEIGKLLSDKSKVDILELVSGKPYYGKELADALELSTATISYHVNALLKANLLKAEIISNKVYYSINNEMISAQLDGIKSFFAAADDKS
ncbi:DNA-binding transcriptional ArsR family regulator [Herbinix hemicellulosilytica]|uniref:HTH arsR-type domain-containing protein n=1 Tax=Herbinix hemicellulosilytica TaxID=1564487 RepID=A0A0H5SSQ4_HERHM|nr:winged helix-turn-helix domain-containing protein [Herbinix hemicellulosilytica]RBP58284.1 DNA-binding transcriptional ArsR family regulator [Herbinix hemicellulosilytica]CRZ33328.1 hypothetical protein HHT355_0113 [Herbinix hemicellulosilytica]